MGSMDGPVQEGRGPEGCSGGFSEADLVVLSSCHSILSFRQVLCGEAE